MRQLSAASSTNLPPDYAAHPGAPPPHQQQQQQQQPFDGNHATLLQ
jgi:polyadenylation factor subunit 2